MKIAKKPVVCTCLNQQRELEQFLNSNQFASVANNPAFSNLQTNTFDVAETASVITGAPLMKMEVLPKAAVVE